MEDKREDINRGTNVISELATALFWFVVFMIFVPGSVNEFFDMSENEYAGVELRLANLWSSRDDFVDFIGLGDCFPRDYHIIDATGSRFLVSMTAIHVEDTVNPKNPADSYRFSAELSGIQQVEKDPDYLFALVYLPGSKNHGILILKTANKIPENEN